MSANHQMWDFRPWIAFYVHAYVYISWKIYRERERAESGERRAESGERRAESGERRAEGGRQRERERERERECYTYIHMYIYTNPPAPKVPRRGSGWYERVCSTGTTFSWGGGSFSGSTPRQKVHETTVICTFYRSSQPRPDEPFRPHMSATLA